MYYLLALLLAYLINSKLYTEKYNLTTIYFKMMQPDYDLIFNNIYFVYNRAKF